MWLVDERTARFVADDLYRIPDGELQEGKQLARNARFLAGDRCQTATRHAQYGRNERVAARVWE